MGSYSDYLENALLDHLLGKAAFAQPTVHVGLSTADPGEDGSGLAEPAGGSYARVATAAADWSAAAAGQSSNANDLSFPAATAPWGVCAYFFLADAAAAGNILAYGALNAARDVQTGDAPYFPAGDLAVTLD